MGFNRGLNAMRNEIIRQSHNINTNGLYLNLQRYKTILAAIDGTRYGYLALQEAFEMSNSGDLIIGYNIPLDAYHFAYEHLVFQPGVTISPEQREEYESKKLEFISEINEKVMEIKTNSLKRDVVEFRFIVGPDSIAIKQDLVDAAEEFNADALVMGCKGTTHSLKERLTKTVVHMLGSVPDYCVHNAKCSVYVVKPKE